MAFVDRVIGIGTRSQRARDLRVLVQTLLDNACCQDVLIKSWCGRWSVSCSNIVNSMAQEVAPFDCRADGPT